MRNTLRRCVLLLLAVGALASPVLAADKVLSVVATATGAGTATAYPGQTIDVDIQVDDATLVAGAAFSVTFDAAILALSKVSSTFFGTFADQGLTPAAVTVNTVTWYSPLVTNPVTTGVMLAAARTANGAGTQFPLFTLSFLVKGSSGSHQISIAQSRIANTTAGYPEAGELIPYLMGVDADVYTAHTVSTVFPLTLTIENADVDNDGLPDAWEVDHFGNTITANGASDYDWDGYTDLQEFLNQTVNATDPAGGAYDPKLANAPGGTGYVQSDDDFWTIMTPVIINSGKQQ